MSSRVLITRESAEPLAGLVAAGGAQVVHVPLVQLRPTGVPKPDAVPDVVVVTSAAVVRFVPDLSARLSGIPVAAVGEATAGALAVLGVHPEWVGESGGADLIAGLPDARARLLYVGADVPSEGVLGALDTHQGQVERWGVYSNQLPEGAAAGLAAAGLVSLVALTSPSAARRYAQLAGPTAAPVAAIGDSTADAAREVGLVVQLVPDRPRIDALAAAIVAAL